MNKILRKHIINYIKKHGFVNSDDIVKIFLKEDNIISYTKINIDGSGRINMTSGGETILNAIDHDNIYLYGKYLSFIEKRS